MSYSANSYSSLPGPWLAAGSIGEATPKSSPTKECERRHRSPPQASARKWGAPAPPTGSRLGRHQRACHHSVKATASGKPPGASLSRNAEHDRTPAVIPYRFGRARDLCASRAHARHDDRIAFARFVESRAGIR